MRVLGYFWKGRMGPELPGKPAKHQRTDPPAEDYEHVQRATGVGMSHQYQRAQHAPDEQSCRRDTTSPCQNPHCEICGADVAALAQNYREENHRESENRVGDSDDG